MGKDTGGYAFPHTIEHLHQPVSAGMTLRDYFAAKVMQSIIVMEGAHPATAAGIAYTCADAMLKARGQA
jgi:hypothetical protein